MLGIFLIRLTYFLVNLLKIVIAKLSYFFLDKGFEDYLIRTIKLD